MLKYAWNHYPVLSAEPIEKVYHLLYEEGESAEEMAVLKLENDKYIFVQFSTECASEEDVGVLNILEFDTLEEAANLYEDYRWDK